MTAPDRLAEIKEGLEAGDRLEWEEVQWLISEVERLRNAYGQGWEDGGNATWADFLPWIQGSWASEGLLAGG